MTFHSQSKLPWMVVAALIILAAGFLVIGVQALAGSGSWLAGLLAIGIASLAAFGVSIFSKFAESISVTVDLDQHQVRFLGQLPWHRRRASWRFDEIEGIEPEDWDNGEGKVMWRPLLILKNGQRIPLAANWDRDPLPTNAFCARLGSALKQ